MKRNQNSYTIQRDASASTEAFSSLNAVSAPPLQLWGAWGDDDLRQSGKTSYDQPVFTGQGEAGRTLYVYDNGIAIASTVVSAANNWFIQIPFSAGHHQLTFGYASQQPALSLNFDVVNFDSNLLPPPEVSKIWTQGAELYQGSTITDPTPRFVGDGSAGHVVYAWENGVAIASAKVMENGQWFIDVPALQPGEHSLSFGYTQEQSVYVYDFTLAANHQPVLQSVAENAAPAADIGHNLAEQSHNLSSVSHEKAASNILSNSINDTPHIQQPIEFHGVYDNRTSGTYYPIPENGETRDSSPIFFGRAEPYTPIYVSDNGKVIAIISSGETGQWSFEQELGFGKHVITFSHPAFTTEPLTFTIIGHQPVVLTEAYTDENGKNEHLSELANITDHTPVFKGTADAKSLVYVWNNGELISSVYADHQGHWTYSEYLPDGPYALTFGSNKEEASATEPFDFNINHIPFSIEDINTQNLGYFDPFGQDDVISDTTPYITTLATPGTTVYIWDNGKIIDTYIASADGHNTRELTLENGKHSISVGNEHHPVTQPLEVTVDSTKYTQPKVTDAFTDDTGHAEFFDEYATISDSTPILKGIATPNSWVYVSEGNTSLKTLIVGENGLWFFTGEFSPGVHTVNFSNGFGTPTSSFTFTVESDAVVKFDVNALLEESQPLLIAESDIPEINAQPQLSLNQADLTFISTNGVTAEATKLLLIEQEQTFI